jgi:hypothetical protein
MIRSGIFDSMYQLPSLFPIIVEKKLELWQYPSGRFRAIDFCWGDRAKHDLPNKNQ